MVQDTVICTPHLAEQGKVVLYTVKNHPSCTLLCLEMTHETDWASHCSNRKINTTKFGQGLFLHFSDAPPIFKVIIYISCD